MEEYEPKDAALSGENNITEYLQHPQQKSSPHQKDPALENKSKNAENSRPLQENPRPRPSPSPSVIGIEYELKDLLLADQGNVAKYPPSLSTDSSLSVHSAMNRELIAQSLEDMTWIMPEPQPVQTQGLTELALQAHDLSSRTLDSTRELAGWCREGDIIDRSDRHEGLERPERPDEHIEPALSGRVIEPLKSCATEYRNAPYNMLSNSDLSTNVDYGLSGPVKAVHKSFNPLPGNDDELLAGLAENSKSVATEDRKPSSHILSNSRSATNLEYKSSGPVKTIHNSLNPSSRNDDKILTGLAENAKTQQMPSQALGKESDQPRLTTEGGPANLEHESPDFREEGDSPKQSTHPWLTAVWYRLAAMLDPPTEAVYRAKYTCGCGKLCYIDVEELVPGGAAELEQEIRKEAGLVQCPYPRSSPLPDDNTHAPAPTYSNPLASSSISGQGAPVHYLPSLREQSQSSNTIEVTTQSSASGILTTAQKYLLLCVNTKHGLVKLVNINVSTCRNDQFLFQEIRTAYEIARQNHDWSLATLSPLGSRIPTSILTLTSIVSLPNLGISQWVAGAFGDCKIFVPRRIEFVKFELMPVRLEIYAGNIEKPEIPGLEEVQVKKTYEYEPTTIKAKILNVPIHELLKPGQHLNQYWWKRFPKKLDNPLDFDEGLDCCGWGILITEGWNRPFVLFLCLLAMLSFVIFVAMYSVLTNDGSTGAGIGSFMMAILTLYCTLKYEQWKEQ